MDPKLIELIGKLGGDALAAIIAALYAAFVGKNPTQAEVEAELGRILAARAADKEWLAERAAARHAEYLKP